MSTRISRRDFTKTAAFASLGTLAGGPSLDNPEIAPPQTGACRPAAAVSSGTGRWTNWPETEEGPNPQYVPRTVSDLVAIARNATAQTRVRASGSRWSASAAAKADNSWIDTSAISGVISWDLRQLADQRLSNVDVTNLVLVRAGMKLYALATELWARNPKKSFPTLGGSMGQSLAGAISTATHGSDIDLGPVAGMVRAIHLVAPGGCEYWLEHPARPIASRTALQNNYADWHESIEWVRDADAFKAALVSAGRCGLIYSYVLEVQSGYQLRREKGRCSWSAARAHLERAADSGNWRAFMRGNSLPFNESTTVESRGTPTAIVANGRLSVIWTGTRNPGQFRWIHADPQAGGWTRKRIVDDGKMRRSIHRPAIAFFNGRYYLAWTGTDRNDPYIHLIRSTDASGEYWEDHIRFDGESGRPAAESSEGPVLLAANNRLHIVWVGSNKPGRFRWITSTDGVRWGDRRILEDNEQRESNHRPAIAFFNGRYFLAWTGTNPAHPYLHMIRSTDDSGTAWTGHIRFEGPPGPYPEAKSSDGPCLLAANHRLHLVWVGTNRPGEFRWIVSNEGGLWGDKRVLRDADRARMSNYSPDLVFHNDRYYLFWLGYGSEANVHMLRSVTTTGRRWTAHARLTVPPGPRIDMQQIKAVELVLSPESANGQAWWTVRTPVGMNQLPTRVSAGLKPHEEQLVVQALAKALNPQSGPPKDDVLLSIAGLLLLGGSGGGFLTAIATAIGVSAVANRDDVFGTITDMVFAMKVNGPTTTGPNFEISSGDAVAFNGDYTKLYSEFWSHSPKVVFTEVFFDAQSRNYLRFIDRTLDYFRTAPSGKQAGYISIRFMAGSPVPGPEVPGSEAPLAMQRWPITAAVEVVLLKALDPAARQNLEAVNRIARDYNVRFHWGMIRPADYRPSGVQTDLERWRAGARRLAVRANDGFSSAFSRASGLEP